MKIYNKEQTIKEILELRYDKFKSISSIVNFLVDKYGISEKRSYDLIKLARLRVGEMYMKCDDNIYEDSLNTLDSMKEKAILKKDYKLALDIQKELNKLMQLYVNRIDITSGGEKLNIKDLLGFNEKSE